MAFFFVRACVRVCVRGWVWWREGQDNVVRKHRISKFVRAVPFQSPTHLFKCFLASLPYTPFNLKPRLPLTLCSAYSAAVEPDNREVGEGTFNKRFFFVISAI